jgi:hypothetical protein
MMDNFTCRRCRDTGKWQYDEWHAQPCPDCCTHNEGVWMLTHEYGENVAGNWCCRRGCGKMWDGIVDYQRTQIREPRSAEKLGLTGDGR